MSSNDHPRKVDVIYNKSSQQMNEVSDESIDMVLTSPPYFALRDYGDDVKTTWGGLPNCNHQWITKKFKQHSGRGDCQKSAKYSEQETIPDPILSNAFCQKCGAWYGQLGLEPTFQLYLDHMMVICAEIKRVLKKTGSFWLNMGDTYGGSWQNYGSRQGGQRPKSSKSFNRRGAPTFYPPTAKMPPKCLLGIPWRLTLRLIDEQGWILRNAGIWNKPNSMPSSTKDRLSNSYEFLFHFVKNIKPQYYWNEKTGLMADRKPKELKEGIDWEWKECPKCSGHREIIKGVRAGDDDYKIVLSEKGPETCPRCKGTGKIKHSFWHSLGYYYDLDAIREPHKYSPENRKGGVKKKVAPKGPNQASYNRLYRLNMAEQEMFHPAGRNPGDVWIIPTQPRPEAHFATFPDALCIKPILATCPLEICKKCGRVRVRITNKNYTPTRPGRNTGTAKSGTALDPNQSLHQRDISKYRMSIDYQTIGWTDCGCNAGWDSGVLLDPFAGKGTALIMAKKLGRHYIGYELKKEYCEKLIKPALNEIDPLFQRREIDASNSEIPCLVHREE